MREERRRKKIIKYLLIVLAVIAALAAVFVILMRTVFVIRMTDVTGCENSSAQAVIEAVTAEEYSENSLLLFLQLRTGNQPDIEFVESVQVSFVTPWHICLKVTEKTLYGVIYDSGTYSYFDSSGTVVEISENGIEGTMELQGTISGDASEGEALPLVPDGSLSYVTDVFSLLAEYEMDVDLIYLDTSGHIYFNTEEITVQLGADRNTEEKFKNLALILDQLEGRSGTLDLTTFESAGDDIIFTENEVTESDT